MPDSKFYSTMVRPERSSGLTFLKPQLEEANQWDDLRFPVGGVNAPGPTNEPSLNPDTGLLEFSGSATNVVTGLAQMPHSWMEESSLGPHIHWIQTGVGNALWRFQYRVFCAVDCDFPEEWTTVESAETTHEYPGTGSRVMITGFPSPDMSGMKISSMILFKISRIGGDALDTLAVAAPLLEFDIHHQVDSFGSRQTFIK